MSVYSKKGKGWRYDFTLNGTRHTEAWFKTKAEAKAAEARTREEVKNPKVEEPAPTDMDFLELVNARLDYVQEYNSERHYTDHLYMARRWVKQWNGFSCKQISSGMIQDYLIGRKRQASGYTANKELRCLRAMFNYAMHPTREWMQTNPTRGIEFFPVEKRIKYLPPKEDVLRVISGAEPDTIDYLWAIALTMGRVSEINRLTWDDVDLKNRSVVLYTRKKKGGSLTPRRIPMSDRLFRLIESRYQRRDGEKPWVFWHRYWSRKQGRFVEGPFKHRKLIMASLCTKAGVRHFGFHALRHFGASLLDHSNVPIGSIQKILGHENRTTTEIYLHSIRGAERAAIDLLDDGFAEKSHTESHIQEKGANRVCG